MIELIGHLHPLIVHLPIGILLLAIFIEWLPAGKKFRTVRKSINFILVIGAVTAIFSCITGYILSQRGEYESAQVDWHQWMGISLTIYALAYAKMRKGMKLNEYRKIFSLILFLLITVTGHLGGTLTHGEGYLNITSKAASAETLKNVNLNTAIFYEDLVRPIFEQKCYSCHGSAKQKGKLRLDKPEYITKGGEEGAVLIAGNVGESELIHRLLLPMQDEDHMPPKEKPQLTAQEIEIMKSWISSGADFSKSVADAGQQQHLQKILGAENVSAVQDVPTHAVEPSDKSILMGLQKLGVVVLPVSANSNYLSVNLINTTSVDSAVDLLIKMKEQVIWLKAGGQPITDSHLARLSALKKLTRLNLDGTKITDAGIGNLKSITTLQYLNLNNTNITSVGVSNLASLKQVKSIFLYGTKIKLEELEAIRSQMPNTLFETGNYVVPLIPFDTTEAKAPSDK